MELEDPRTDGTFVRVIIRRETTADIRTTAHVHRQAFDGEEPAEVRLVDALRSDDSWVPQLSLVAQVCSTVVGHVCLTRATVDDLPVLALRPIGVLPEHQACGVGSALMHECLGDADAMEAPLVALTSWKPDMTGTFRYSAPFYSL